MQFYVILPDLRLFIQRALNVIDTIGDLPVASDNHKLIAKCHPGILRIMDTMRLMPLF